jgi:dihydroflavonol-4-reductase
MATDSTSAGIVLVTGGSGFIASYCIGQLLNDGWEVRTTLRDGAKAGRVRQTVAQIASRAEAIAFAEADLISDLGWRDAVAGVQYVLHVASPLRAANDKDDDALLRPAREGTLRVLRAARDCGVKRVVVTSSISAIVFGRGGRPTPFTEEDWTDETNRADTSAYDRSKTLAERAAWAWLRVEGGGLELATVNPSYVLGPALGADFSFSLEVVKKLLDRSVPGLARFGFPIVDVRDLARLHVLAMTSPAAAGQRFIGSGEFFWMRDIAQILRDGLGAGGRVAPKYDLPDFLVRLIAIVDPVVRGRLYDLGKERRVSSDKARQRLGWVTRPGAETILDTARSLQALGVV